MELEQKINLLLCPPGDGVYTVNTAREKKAALQEKLYGEKDSLKIRAHWEESLKKLPSAPVLILGICSDTGGGILRGANWGPLFLRQHLLEDMGGEKETFQTQILDIGDVWANPHLLHEKYLNERTIANCRQSLYGDKNLPLPVAPLSVTEELCQHIYHRYPNKKIFAIGGDHSVSYPLVKSYLRAKRQHLGKRVAVIHFDAHTDLLRKRLGIDICFGSWAAHIIEELSEPRHLIQIGIRSSARGKSHWENTWGVKQYWASDVKNLGPQATALDIVNSLEKDTIDQIYVTFDIDALDIEYASETGTPEKGGLFPHEAMIILQALAARFPITGGDMVELAPFIKSPTETTMTSATSISRFLLETMAMGQVKTHH